MDTNVFNPDTFNPDTFNFGNVDFLLDQAVTRVPHIRGVILLTSDGLLRSRTKQTIDLETAQRMAAACTGLQATSRGMADFIATEMNPAGGWRQTMVEFDHGYVLVVSAGQGTYLAIATGGQADLRQVGQWSQELVQSVGDVLSAPTRPDVGSVS
ncbi:roadblock/LC7 domain-containing protein [Sphaerisporangium sp. NPDC049003]|uniref:roadblock/LC7 domain-containing protein n=1 Tax=Sphaerisporangium sp. NPDC049003 TaxID=3364517 RepID=UPI00372490B5